MTRSRQRAARRDNSRRPRRPSIPEPVWTLRRGTGLLSLDVFGAALDRLVLVPADIHGLVAGELAGSGTPLPASYPDIRLAAERQAWRRARRSGRAFIGLADIADELVALLPSDGSDPRGLGRLAIAREVALERRLSRPNPEAVAAVAEARRQGVPVAFVADTYLPRDLVAALLRSAGLPAELVLVSSHEGATKDGGDLFRHLADRAGVRLDRIVHLGPDPAIDVGGPARMGIDARRLVPAHRSVAAGLAGGVDGPSALDSVALALAARRLGAGRAGGSSTVAGTPAAPSPEVGYGVAGPLSVGFAAWVGAQIDDQQPDLVLFADAAAHRTPALVQELRPDLPADRLRPLPVVSPDSVAWLVDHELAGTGCPPDPRVLVVGLGWPDPEHRRVSRVLAGAGARTATVGGAYLGLVEPAGERERVETWAFGPGPPPPHDPAPVATAGARDLLAGLMAPPQDCGEVARGIDDFTRDLSPWLNDGGASLTAALATPALKLVERQAEQPATPVPETDAPPPERRSRVPGRHR
ncbi:MAG: hypothetical protein R2761_12395 [Acidimicrobiales bacterium]